ncbi:MAG: phosphotransferase family protein [bacterium]
MSTKTRKKSGKRKSQTRTLAQTTEHILKTQVKTQEFPGGKSRDSRRMILANGEQVIATRRENPAQMAREKRVLAALNKHEARVPRLLGHDHWRVLVQSELEGERLSQKFQGNSEEEYENIMAASLESLARIHQAGSADGLDKSLPPVGATKAWVKGLIQRPATIGKFFDIRPKRPDLEGLEELLAIKKPRFVKWDSRPGNAMMGFDGQVSWFDWEHAATRNRLDDMAWIMGDEFVPDYPQAEARLIDKYLPLFADHMDADTARDYLMAYGTLHISVRLGLILKTKKDGEWWDPEYCIQGDKVGVTQEFATNLCKRGARWSAQTCYTESLSPWFENMEKLVNSF